MDDVTAAVEAASARELVFGLGKKNAIVKASYGEFPHLGIPGGSGGASPTRSRSLPCRN